jgi:hypothetical protein
MQKYQIADYKYWKINSNIEGNYRNHDLPSSIGLGEFSFNNRYKNKSVLPISIYSKGTKFYQSSRGINIRWFDGHL